MDCTGWADIAQQIESRTGGDEPYSWIFRGQEQAKWQLVPSLERLADPCGYDKALIRAENALIAEFQSQAQPDDVGIESRDGSAVLGDPLSLFPDLSGWQLRVSAGQTLTSFMSTGDGVQEATQVDLPPVRPTPPILAPGRV